MSEVPVWIERKFTFAFSVELYPNFRIRLRGTPARLEEFCRGLSPAQLTHKPDGKWSIQEHAGHLLSVEDLWLTRFDEYLAGSPTLTAANISNARTQQARYNERVLEEILGDFRRVRTGFVDRLDALAAADFARVAHHPRLNMPMRLVDHLCFIAEHDDHHLARIWELRRG